MALIRLICVFLTDSSSFLLVPDSATMSAMLKREQKLRQSPSCQRAIMLPLSSRHEINRQIRLRVVREFNLPDAVADLLEVKEILTFYFSCFPVQVVTPESVGLLNFNAVWAFRYVWTFHLQSFILKP